MEEILEGKKRQHVVFIESRPKMRMIIPHIKQQESYPFSCHGPYTPPLTVLLTTTCREEEMSSFLLNYLNM
jgi:hypothetical protein